MDDGKVYFIEGRMLSSKVKGLAERCAPYYALLRLHSIEISLFAAFPTFASIVLASSSVTQAIRLCILSVVGAVVVRSAGCVINDIFDRDIDSQVTRTKNRPLAAGSLTVTQALKALLPLLCITGLILLCTNFLTLYLSIFFAGGIIIYPLMKRFFAYPQFILGFVFNCGVLIGSAMAAGKIVFGSAIMYIGCIFWTIAYDTIYAHQDKKDDAILGLGNTALKFADNTGTYLKRLHLLTVTMWVCAGVVSSLNFAYYLCMLAIMCTFFYQSRKSNFDSPERCMYMFKSNIYIGFLLFLGVCVGVV